MLLLIQLLSITAVVCAALALRYKLLSDSVWLAAIALAAVILLVCAVISLYSLLASISTVDLPHSIGGLISLTTLLLLGWLIYLVVSNPNIHDVATSEQLSYTTLSESRKSHHNTLPKTAALIDSSLVQYFADDIDHVFYEAQESAIQKGWTIAGHTVNSYAFEAVASTPLLRFNDDIRIELTDTPQGVRLDMRSASRVGSSDLGANRDRIRRFMKSVRARLEK